MKYEGMIIRPPSEAHSLLLQVTVGCSHNRCIFCPSFKDKRFRIKEYPEIEEDILEASRYGVIERVFLCDGDALIIPQRKLVPVLESIAGNIRGVKRIATYGNAKSVLRKTPEELRELRALGLSLVYLGLESGNQELLRWMNKGVGPDDMIEAARRVREAGMDLSVTVLLGIGGREKSAVHGSDTAKVLSEMDPRYVGALTVMIVPGTPLHDLYREGRFQLPDTFGFLRELGAMIGQSRFTRCYFTANHASNYLPLRVRLPEQKEEAVRLIRQVVEERNQSVLRPEFLRAL
ncbi:MAG TPA: radical SAM protein [Syntrophales bacterium]|nr:radical SAM protein [Syntrophales bacterium]